MTKTKKKHALADRGGTPRAICGFGQGRQVFSHVIGTPIDDLATLDIDQHVTCQRCRQRVRRRFPLWFDMFGGFIRR